MRPASVGGTGSDRSRQRGTRTPYAPALGLREVFRRFWPYTRSLRGRVALAVALGLLLPVVEGATVWMFKLLVDRVLVPQDLGEFWWIAAASLAITSAAGSVSFASAYLSRWLAQHFALALRTDLFAHLHGLSLDVLEHRHLGDTLSRLTSDVSAVERLVVSGVTRTLSNAFRVLLFAGLLFWLSWPLALLALATIPPFALAARAFAVRIKAETRRSRHHLGAMTSVAQESLASAPLVQAYQRQDAEVARFDDEGRHRLAAKLVAARLSAGFRPLIDALELVGVLAVFGVGTWQMSHGGLSLGGLLAFVGYLSQLLGPVRSLSRLASTVYAASAGAERIVDLQAETSSVRERGDARDLPRAAGVVELDHVGFTYPGTTRPVLHDVCARVGPGQVLALCGPSGSGKSTVAKLVMRLFEPTSGSVRLDDHDLGDLRIESVRANVAVVLQEQLVLHGTIAENIAYGRSNASAADVRRAARDADLDAFVRGLPDGYDTVVGERGRRLSGGQRQRLAIARALLRDAPVLILDEPTAGLDAVTADRVLAPLRRLMSGRTTIIVSHDPPRLLAADTVLSLAYEDDHAPVGAR